MSDAANFDNASRIDKAIRKQLLYKAPVISSIPFITIKGIQIPTYDATSPTTAFRAENTGFSATHTAVTKSNEKCYPLGGDNPIDVMSVKQAKSAGMNPADFLEKQTLGLIGSAVSKGETQIFYGTNTDDDGFNGLHTRIDKDGDYFVNAGGTEADDTTLTSVYACIWEDGFATGIWGDGQIIGQDSIHLEGPKRITDSSNRGYMGYELLLESYFGIKVDQDRAIGQIGNISVGSTGADQNPLTDALMKELLREKMNYQEWDLSKARIYMNWDAFTQLESDVSITWNSYSVFGREDLQVPYYLNIPIIITDKIVSTESEKIPA